jgi:hypothetical protein
MKPVFSNPLSLSLTQILIFVRDHFNDFIPVLLLFTVSAVTCFDQPQIPLSDVSFILLSLFALEVYNSALNLVTCLHSFDLRSLLIQLLWTTRFCISFFVQPYKESSI